MKLWQRLRRERSGLTLVELMAGTAMAGLILITVASMEISAWKFRVADEVAFAGQAEATTLLSRFAQDVRQSGGITLAADGASTVTITVPGGAVTYALLNGQVVRQGQAIMQNASALQFYREDGGRTLRAVVTAANGYRVESRATARLAAP